MAFDINYRFSEIAGVNATPITETQLVVDLSYKAAGYRGLLLSEAPLKEFPTTPITVLVGATAYTEVDITAGYPSGTNFCVEYSSNSGVIYLPTAVALGTSCTVTYKATGTVASIESKQYNLDGTVGAPGISFANDPDTGRYRIGANTVGESVGGVKVAEINSLGLINGTAGTEFRNVLQVIQGATDMIYSTAWSQVSTTNYILQHKGSITPKSNTSKIIITGNLSVAMVTTASNLSVFLYYDTSPYGAVRTTSVALPAGVLISSHLAVGPSGPGLGLIGAPIFLGVMTGHVAGTTYYISAWSKNSAAQATSYNTSNTTSQIIFQEIL